MSTKLSRWGNSLGLRIPRYVVDCAHLKAGDELLVRLLDTGQILVCPANPVLATTDGATGGDQPASPALRERKAPEEW